MADEANKEADLSKAMLAADESKDFRYQEWGRELPVHSELRFHEGFRSVFNIMQMLEGRIKLELVRSKMLQELSCRWTKKFAAAALLGKGEFDHGTLYGACTKLLLEPIEEANIHNRVRNEMLDFDGPMETLRIWLSDMTESPVPHRALQRYYQADKRQKRIEEKIGLAMMKYHYITYKLDKIREVLEIYPALVPAEIEVELQRKYDLYSDKADSSKQKYLDLLSQEREGRESYLEDVRESKKEFDWFEKSRLFVIKNALKKYIMIMTILDVERAEHKKTLTEIRGILSRMDINEEVANLIEKHMMKIQFPIYQEFDESIISRPHPPVSPSGMKEAIFPREKSFFRKKGGKITPWPGTSGSDDVQRTMLSVDDNSGYTYHDDNGEGDFKMTLCEEKDEVSTIESNSGQSQQQEQPKTKDSGIDGHERDFKATILSRKAFLSDETVQDDVAEFMSEISDVADDPEIPSAADLTTFANIKVIAVQPYQAQAANELSFKQGQTIRQKIPANSMGMAYGWTKSRKFSRKQYGFYPASLVQLKPKKHSARGGAGLISQSSDTDDGSKTPSPHDVTTLANAKVVAVESYQAQAADELSLRKGQSIKQKLPANSNGMSFGWTKASRFSQKQYGFYPASIVQLKPKKTGIRALLSDKTAPLNFS